MLAVRDASAIDEAGSRVIEPVTFNLKAGDCLALVGRNGSGKTTFLEILAGGWEASSGTIESGARAVISAVPRNFEEAAAAGIVYAPSSNYIFRGMTVRENLEVILPQRKWTVDDWEFIRANFGHLLLRRDQLTETLSGGEARLLGVALSVLVLMARRRQSQNHHQVLLLDEPSVGLDKEAKGRMQNAMVSLKAAGAILLIADESSEFVLPISEWVLVFEARCATWFGSTEEFYRNRSNQLLKGVGGL